MDFLVFLIIIFLGVLSASYICSKNNLSLKIRFKLNINSRNKVILINIMVIVLLCFVYGVSKKSDNIIVKISGAILLFALVFIYYIASDIKGMIMKEEAEEKNNNKYKFKNEFCYFCGYKLENNENICPNCGKNIGDSSKLF